MYPGIVQQENLANTEEQLRRLLFGKGQEGVWFDPSDLSTMFQDVDGTIPVTADGDPLGMIMDKSGKGNHAIASSPTDFTYRTDGTLHWIETTTVGTLAFDSIIYPDESNVCRFGINKRNPGSNIGALSSTISSVSTRWIMVSYASGVGNFGLTGPIYNQTGPSRVNGAVFTGDRADLYNITSSGISVVGVVGINCSAENGQAIGVSGRYDSQPFDGNSMYGFIEYHDNLSQGVYEFVEQYLADKAGVIL